MMSSIVDAQIATVPLSFLLLPEHSNFWLLIELVLQYNVSVTSGANQALASLMITLLDPTDRTVMFKPYYFNALMAVQMMGGANTVMYGPSHPETFHPDLDWLEKELQGPNKPKLVYIVNPCNPTGTNLPWT